MPRIKQIVGLDIGSRTVRAAWVCMRDHKPVVVRTEQLALPPDVQDSAGIVRAWITQCGLTRQFCAIALPGSSTIFQPGKIPHADPRSARQVAAMELAAFNDMAGDSMTFDVADYRIATDPAHRYYLMAMARPVIVERTLQFAAQIGVRPADLVPAPVALFNRLERFAGPHTAPNLYLDIGHQQTEVAVGIPSGLLFARSIPIGGKALTDALAQAAGLSVHQAEIRKHADGLTGETAAILKPAVDRWLSQVASCVSVCRSTLTSPALAPGQIVLAGAGAALIGLRGVLADRFKLPVHLASELPGCADLAPDNAPSRVAVSTFSLAVGLAVSALELGPTHLSMLPSHLRDEVVFRDKKPYWIAAAICTALALGVFTVTGLRALAREDRLLQTERTHLREREQIDKEITAIRSRATSHRTRANLVLDLLMNAPLTREALTWVANSMGPDDWIVLFCDESSYTQQSTDTVPRAVQRGAASRFSPITIAPPKAKPRPAPAPVRVAAPAVSAPRAATQTFIVEGYTTDPSWDSVKKIISRLKTSPRVAAVDLREDDRVLPPVGLSTSVDLATLPTFRRFVISLEVKRP
jgi:Tfp pilus assembly PilM family ATPase